MEIRHDRTTELIDYLLSFIKIQHHKHLWKSLGHQPKLHKQMVIGKELLIEGDKGNIQRGNPNHRR
jgi:hypothetical protein